MSAYSTACHAVGSTSDRYRNRSSGGPAGTLIGPYCACGTRRSSACPPGTSPYSFVYPKRAAPRCCSRTCVVSHCDCSPWLHMKQLPHAMLNGITTRSPGAIWVTSGPTSSTIPIGSCPHIALLEERAHQLVGVQVRAADRGQRDAHDRVGRLFDPRIRDLLDADVTPAVPGDRLHDGDLPGDVRPKPQRRSTQIFSPRNSVCVGSHGKKITTLKSTRAPEASNSSQSCSCVPVTSASSTTPCGPMTMSVR